MIRLIHHLMFALLRKSIVVPFNFPEDSLDQNNLFPFELIPLHKHPDFLFEIFNLFVIHLCSILILHGFVFVVFDSSLLVVIFLFDLDHEQLIFEYRSIRASVLLFRLLIFTTLIVLVDIIYRSLELLVNLIDELLIIGISGVLMILKYFFTDLHYMPSQYDWQQLKFNLFLIFWQETRLCGHAFDMAPKYHHAEEFKYCKT